MRRSLERRTVRTSRKKLTVNGVWETHLQVLHPDRTLGVLLRLPGLTTVAILSGRGLLPGLSIL